MFTESYFYDPQIDFDYICDRELWENIFLNPVPYDYKNPNSIKVNLFNFIEIKECVLETNSGDENCNLIDFKDMYYRASEEMKSLVFITLSNFMQRFNRPFSHCYVLVPNHPSISPIKEYSPLELFYNTPQFPMVNSLKNRFSLKIEESAYYDLYLYAFGKEFTEEISPTEPFTLFFSFSCINGFIV